MYGMFAASLTTRRRLNTSRTCITSMANTLSVRVSQEVADRLVALSKSIDRTKTYIVQKALEEYLEEYEDYLVAVHRLNDKDDAIISERQLAGKLAK